MTKHTNSKHREAAVDFEDCEKSRLTFESLAGIVDAIKTSLCTDDLYGTELIAGVKIASYSKALFDAVLRLYEKFCCKKNQDRLLEEFYGLILDASTYLNCPIRWPTTANATQCLLNTTTYFVRHDSRFTKHNKRLTNHNNKFTKTHH